MSKGSLFGGADIPLLVLVTLFIVNFLLNANGVIAAVINMAIRRMAREAERAGKVAIHKELVSSAEAHPSGQIIGTIETTLYLYAFVTQIHGLITAVILFKAFSGWLSPKAEDAATEIHNLRTLTRYYTYALGNLISLLSSILLFEIASCVARILPHG
jgi:hypothetical protein